MSHTTDTFSEKQVIPAARLEWRRLQIASALATLASLAIPMLLTLRLEPFLLSMAAPLVIGLLLSGRWPRTSVVWLGITSAGLLLSGLPFLAEALTHPESRVDFIPLLLFAVATLAASIAAVPAFREAGGTSSRSDAASKIAAFAAVTFVAGAIWSLVASAGVRSAPAAEDDIPVVAEDFLFVPDSVRAQAGTVAIHVTNRDDTRHTFTIDDLGVDLNIPPNTTQRIAFDAEAGTYRFYCRPHPSEMVGEMIVR